MLFKTWLEKGINFQLTTNWYTGYSALRCITRVRRPYPPLFEANTHTSVIIFVNLQVLCIKTLKHIVHDERKEDTGFQSGVNTNYFRGYTFSRWGHRGWRKKGKTNVKRTGGFLPFHAHMWIDLYGQDVYIYIYFFFSDERATALKTIRYLTA